MIYEDRLKKGKEFENEIFNKLQRYNEIPHSSDRIIWRSGTPIFVEIKSSLLIEWGCWLDQWKIVSQGYKIIIVCKEPKTNTIMADWIENIEIRGPIKGNTKNGSGNDYGIMTIQKTLCQFFIENFNLNKKKT